MLENDAREHSDILIGDSDLSEPQGWWLIMGKDILYPFPFFLYNIIGVLISWLMICLL
jgi:hypothetical protein